MKTELDSEDDSNLPTKYTNNHKMRSYISEKFDILAMENEDVIREVSANGSFAAYQTLKNAWHPFVLAVLPIIFIINLIARNKSRYWITSQRIIGVSGIFGTTTASIPLTRIADVRINNSLLHKLLSTKSVYISDIGGDNGIYMISIENAPEISVLILELIDKQKKRINS